MTLKISERFRPTFCLQDIAYEIIFHYHFLFKSKVTFVNGTFEKLRPSKTFFNLNLEFRNFIFIRLYIIVLRTEYIEYIKII